MGQEEREIMECQFLLNELVILRKEIMKDSLKKLILSNLLCWLANFIGILILVITTDFNNYAIAMAIILATIYTFVNCVIYILINNISLNLKINKEMKQPQFDIKEVLENGVSTLPIEKILNSEADKVITNEVIKVFAFTLCYTFIAIMLVFSLSGNSTAKEQKEFFIVMEMEEHYAVIYNNSKDLILKKAILDGDSIVIDLTEQKIISSKNVTMKKYKFNTVKIISEATLDKK